LFRLAPAVSGSSLGQRYYDRFFFAALLRAALAAGFFAVDAGAAS
jgi:hypothetical protein